MLCEILHQSRPTSKRLERDFIRIVHLKQYVRMRAKTYGRFNNECFDFHEKFALEVNEMSTNFS